MIRRSRPIAKRGEGWLVDLGMAAKARPAVILNIPFLDHERALYAIVPHTPATRGGRFEVNIDMAWLHPGSFDVQGQRNIPGSVLIRKMGTLNEPQMALIVQVIQLWLGIV